MHPTTLISRWFWLWRFLFHLLWLCHQSIFGTLPNTGFRHHSFWENLQCIKYLLPAWIYGLYRQGFQLLVFEDPFHAVFRRKLTLFHYCKFPLLPDDFHEHTSDNGISWAGSSITGVSFNICFNFRINFVDGISSGVSAIITIMTGEFSKFVTRKD